MSARNRELLALIPVALLVTAGFTAVFIVQSDEIGDLSLIYGGYFLALCLAAHLFLRFRLPVRRSLPVPALRAARGGRAGRDLPDRRRASPSTRRRCSCSGLVLFAATIVLPARLPRARALPLPDRDRRHRCSCCAPFTGIGDQVNGAYLSVDIGPLSFQPAELAKICIVIFLASYLREKREMLLGRRRGGSPGSRSRRSSTSARCWSSGARRC